MGLLSVCSNPSGKSRSYRDWLNDFLVSSFLCHGIVRDSQAFSFDELKNNISFRLQILAILKLTLTEKFNIY